MEYQQRMEPGFPISNSGQNKRPRFSSVSPSGIAFSPRHSVPRNTPPAYRPDVNWPRPSYNMVARPYNDQHNSPVMFVPYPTQFDHSRPMGKESKDPHCNIGAPVMFVPYPPQFDHSRPMGKENEDPNSNIRADRSNVESMSRKRPYEENQLIRQPAKIYDPSAKSAGLRTKSARVLSGGVDKVLLWMKMIGDHNVMFEIIGKMEYVRTGKFPCEKIFTLRDVTSGPAIQVFFYEIDRTLQELEPGSLIKVYGCMKSRSRFQAFNVVPSSLEEFQASQHVFFICDRAAQELFRVRTVQQ